MCNLAAYVGDRPAAPRLLELMSRQEGWAGGHGNFTSSQEAYDTLHIGDAATARKLQAKTAEKKK